MINISDPIKQFSSFQQIQYQIDMLLSFIHFMQSDDVFVFHVSHQMDFIDDAYLTDFLVLTFHHPLHIECLYSIFLARAFLGRQYHFGKGALSNHTMRSVLFVEMSQYAMFLKFLSYFLKLS